VFGAVLAVVLTWSGLASLVGVSHRSRWGGARPPRELAGFVALSESAAVLILPFAAFGAMKAHLRTEGGLVSFGLWALLALLLAVPAVAHFLSQGREWARRTTVVLMVALPLALARHFATDGHWAEMFFVIGPGIYIMVLATPRVTDYCSR